MIIAESLTAGWISHIARSRKTDPGLVEKVVRACWLLEGLAEHQLPFTFKGGTALMLKSGSTQRLSIDIDIILPEPLAGLYPTLQAVARSRQFSSVTEQQRSTQGAIRKAHYRFTYPSVIKHREDVILLDILFEEPCYHHVQPLPIQSPFLVMDGERLQVPVPSFEDLAGDKLTAFAPNTTGIPYMKNGQSASMEIIKQLYDLGYLFQQVTDLDTVHRTFHKMAAIELGYRGHSFPVAAVLEDTLQTALCLTLRGQAGQGNFMELAAGVKRLQPYIFSGKYMIDQAITHAAQVAYLVRLLQSSGSLVRYQHAAEIRDWWIEQPANTKLNKLRKTNPEAFYYWYKVCTAD